MGSNGRRVGGGGSRVERPVTGGGLALEAKSWGALVLRGTAGGCCGTLAGGGREGGGREVVGEAKSPNSSSWSSREDGWERVVAMLALFACGLNLKRERLFQI